MKKIDLENIEICLNEDLTRQFYSKQKYFIDDCPYITNYVNKVPKIMEIMNGLDKKFGIDLLKNVGQGMDEFMPHDYKKHSLYTIPYYLVGKCFVSGDELTKNHNGPIFKHTPCAKYIINDNLSMTIINTSSFVKIAKANSILSLWLEFKTELLNVEY